MSTARCYEFFPDLPKMDFLTDNIILRVYDPDFAQDFRKSYELRKETYSIKKLMGFVAEEYDRKLEYLLNIDKSLAPKILHNGPVMLWDNDCIKFAGLAIITTEMARGGVELDTGEF